MKTNFYNCNNDYNNKILLYGGYGFYSYKPYITEFSEKTKEWFKTLCQESVYSQGQASGSLSD